MRTIKLGGSSIDSSILGFGCMGMSEFYGARNDEESLKTLKRAFELGITHFDTSNIYGRGHNEQLVGRFVRGKRDRVMIATKFGIVRDPDGPEGSAYDRDLDNSPAYMRRCCEASLQRLGTEVIDLYFVHRADPNVPIEETAEALGDLVRAGKIRGYGLSEVTPAQLRRAHAVHPVTALQSEYSLWTREAEAEVLPLCRELGITFVAYSPLGRGFLTGAVQKTALSDQDFRLTSPRFQGENFDRNQALVEKVRAFAEQKGCTAGQIALAWLFHRGQDIVPIPGTKRIRYLEENVGSLQVALSDADLHQLDHILPPGAAAGTRYESTFAGAPKAPTR